MRLSGTVALITGGSSGIGLAIAARFLSEGAQVVITGRDVTRGQDAARGLGREALFVAADAADPEQVEQSIMTAVERFGKIDTLVNNAGVMIYERLVDTPTDTFDTLMAVNLRGPFLYARGCFPALAETRGSMVHISSDAGLRAEQPIGAYSVSKAAVTMMSQVLALDGAAHGVRSNCICPGATAPGMRHSGPVSDPERGEDPANLPVAPLGRRGDVQDMAAAAAYLASPEAAFVSGAVLLIDGAMGAGLYA